MDHESLAKNNYFQLVGFKEKNFDRDNLRKRGLKIPTQCPLCFHKEERMNHLLDECPFSSSFWDRGATIFHRSDRVKCQSDQTLKEWNMKGFKNPILRLIWVMFPRMLTCVLWKERNSQSFWDKRSSKEEVWKHLVHNI